jgi:elongation factor 2
MAGNVWATDERGNALISYVQEGERISKVKDAIIQGFLWACKTGPLCEQPLRNLKVKIVDAQIHEDPAKREPIQIMRATSRAIFGSILTAKPTLLEPIYRIEISTPTQWFGTCTRIITSRRGKIQATKNKGRLTIITGYIPVAETFGLTSEIRSATSGHAFWQSTFTQWRKASGHVAVEIVKQIRTRKGLPPEVPKPDLFIDKTYSASANEDDT